MNQQIFEVIEITSATGGEGLTKKEYADNASLTLTLKPAWLVPSTK